jgi:2-C-methyl-D-erythritol 4-phosphate cytidylyltransferase
MSKPGDILVLLAAGFARRMQKVVDDKITATLLDKPVFFYSLNAFYATGKIEKVVITYRDAEQLQKIQTAYATFNFPNWKVEYVLGGESRQASVLAALETCADHQGLVHIHDGARPLITPASINLVRAQALKSGAAILAGRAADTIKIAQKTGNAVEMSPDRSLVWTAETPQVFRTSVILKAYRKVNETGAKVTDDSSAVATLGQEISLVENTDVNIKLTRPSDFTIAEAILKSRA